MYPNPDPKNDDFFNRFWAVYPRKINKKRARMGFDIQITEQHANPEQIIAGASRYAHQMRVEQQPQRFIKCPDGWLEDERWTDEVVDPTMDRLRTSDHPLTDAVRESMRQDTLSFFTPTTKRIQ